MWLFVIGIRKKAWPYWVNTPQSQSHSKSRCMLGGCGLITWRSRGDKHTSVRPVWCDVDIFDPGLTHRPAALLSTLVTVFTRIIYSEKEERRKSHFLTKTLNISSYNMESIPTHNNSKRIKRGSIYRLLEFSFWNCSVWSTEGVGEGLGRVGEGSAVVDSWERGGGDIIHKG